MMNKVFIIAEAGINHNGSVANAKKMIAVAAEAGADAVKFQTFKSEEVISKYAPKAEYQKATTDVDESQLDMAKKLELSKSEFEELARYCKEKGVIFLSTAFDFDSIYFLNELGLNTFKIASGEITNLPYLREMGKLAKKVILSTGMANLGEVGDALDIIVKAGCSKDNIVVLHCNTEYPTPIEDVNLLAMNTIKRAFNVDVGYSDHTLGIEIPIAAAALGAKVIEKHFTLDKNMEGPDQRASLDPLELKSMVRAIRNIEKAMGDGDKKASPSELRNKSIARRSIVARRHIRKGEVFSEENLAAKRPGTGISPMNWDEILGKTALKDFPEDSLIKL